VAFTPLSGNNLSVKVTIDMIAAKERWSYHDCSVTCRNAQSAAVKLHRRHCTS